MPAQQPDFVFLSLPLKTRLRIYEYIFIGKPQVIPYCRPPAPHPLPPAILRTCKQIHNEASPILYSKNTFLISSPERILKWFIQIGRANIKLLSNIHIFADPVKSTTDTIFGRASEFSLWYRLLDRLAREATGLRHVYIYWDAEELFGAGKDLRFVRELAKIQGFREHGCGWVLCGTLAKVFGGANGRVGTGGRTHCVIVAVPKEVSTGYGESCTIENGRCFRTRTCKISWASGGNLGKGTQWLYQEE